MDLDTVATAVVGLAGIAAAYFGGRRQERNALAVASKQIDGAAEMAREERRQRRAEAAYLELLTSVTDLRAWSSTMLTGATGGPHGRIEPSSVAPPDLMFDPPLNGGPLVAYWSPRVVELVDQIRVTVGDLRRKAIYMETERRDPGSIPEARGVAAVESIFAASDALERQVVALRTHISAELRGDETGDGEPAHRAGDVSPPTQRTT